MEAGAALLLATENDGGSRLAGLEMHQPPAPQVLDKDLGRYPTRHGFF